MAVTNPMHVSHGLVRMTTTDGQKFVTTLRFNDPINRVFWLDNGGLIQEMPYSAFAKATIPLNR